MGKKTAGRKQGIIKGRSFQGVDFKVKTAFLKRKDLLCSMPEKLI
jgi:hypothetical protein